MQDLSPRTRGEISSALLELHRESLRYWNGLPAETFFRPLGTAWSPADNVRHLSKSIRPVAKALALPRIALLPFGWSLRRGRSYEEMRETYRAALAAGGKAGRFTPSPRPLPEDLDGGRASVMREHEEAADALRRALERWSESALDRWRLPHPLLGKLTVREMLLFTLYHNRHHLEGVRRKLAAA